MTDQQKIAAFEANRAGHVNHIKLFMGPAYGQPDADHEDSFLTACINGLNSSIESFKAAWAHEKERVASLEASLAEKESDFTSMMEHHRATEKSYNALKANLTEVKALALEWIETLAHGGYDQNGREECYHCRGEWTAHTNDCGVPMVIKRLKAIND